jgi:TetR/AcrR family transcriptional regulator
MADGDGARRVRSKTRIGAANADRILDAALAAFAQHGLRGTRLEAIADAARMSKTNLLYYFRSKDDLYRAVLTRTLELWLTPLRELDASDDPATSLAGYIEQKLEYSRRHPEASRLFAMEIMQGAPHLKPVLETELVQLVARKVGIISGWASEGRLATGVEPHHLLFMIWATTQHYADFAVQIGILTGKELADDAFFASSKAAVVNTILRGALAR